jgi:hypothetical protein
MRTWLNILRSEETPSNLPTALLKFSTNALPPCEIRSELIDAELASVGRLASISLPDAVPQMCDHETSVCTALVLLSHNVQVLRRLYS